MVRGCRKRTTSRQTHILQACNEELEVASTRRRVFILPKTRPLFDFVQHLRTRTIRFIIPYKGVSFERISIHG